MSRIKKKDLRGSFTIEAAIIMPIIIIIMVMLIYLGFFQYNRCVMTQKTYVAALRGAIYDEQLEGNILERNRYTETELKNLYGTKILAARGFRSRVEMDNKEVKVHSDTSVKVPFVMLLRNQGYKNGWQIQVEKQVSIYKEIEFIRACRKVEKITGERS